jgi:hypothetical protein
LAIEIISVAGYIFECFSRFMWEVPQPSTRDYIEGGTFCLLFCAFLLATSDLGWHFVFFAKLQPSKLGPGYV